MGLIIATNTDPQAGIWVGIELDIYEKLYVPTDVAVLTLSGSGVYAQSIGDSVTVAGQIAGSDGIWLGSFDPLVTLTFRASILASGIVSGVGTGLYLYGMKSTVINQGTIEGGQAGMSFASVGGVADVMNYGTILGGVGIRQEQSASGKFGFHNFGEVVGLDGVAYDARSATVIDDITNTGRFVGDVNLGGGADRFDGQGGTVTGTVFGGDGGDTFLLGVGADRIDGGAGVDTVSYKSGGAVIVALDGSVDMAGAAAGDELVRIENVTGSNLGKDKLFGDALANELRGLGGVDTISGGAGADRLEGGRGADLLSGGAENDTFFFAGLTDAGDKITDFRNVDGNDDLIYLNGNGFGGGLESGYLDAAFFQSRADNVAQDANDRFIFRTTDQTLWFDADGNGAGAAVMLADLQAGAVLTAADIYIFA